MELIIKPTGRCNFNCKFCSANLLNIKHQTKVPNELIKIIQTIKPNSLIFTGGDPLLVGPEYYYEILSLGNFSISLTTNLKDYYIQPKKWIDLFKNERVGICTSFQYGNERMWSSEQVYSEDAFKKVMKRFKEDVGYTPSFISVISKSNEDKALDHLYLAKELKTKCKINGVLPIGSSKEYYPLYKMIDIWLQIKENNLEEYWDNQIQFHNGGCNFNTNLICSSTIRSFWLDNNNNIHYNNCEDCAVRGSSIPLDTNIVTPKEESAKPEQLISQDCLCCELCRLCNACKSTRQSILDRQTFCSEMKKRKQKILDAKWKIY